MTLYKPLKAVYIKPNTAKIASNRLANVSDEEIAELNIGTVPKSTQYAIKYGAKILTYLTTFTAPSANNC